MGVQISAIIPKTEIELKYLYGKKVAIDAYNTLYQFLSIIRQRDTGEPLRDSKGRITSHLSGLFYRTIKLIDAGIKPIYIYDGKPPDFKKKTVEKRELAREEARKKWKKAVEEGKKEDVMVYAQAASTITNEMMQESKEVLDAMGIPWIQAPSEGEAQCAFICRNGDADYSGSQDYDALMFSSPRLVRNLSITGKRKLPRQEIYIEIRPEIIELDKVLSSLEITKEQLIILGILVGTDYNPQGIKGVGPKTALKIIKEHKTMDKVLEHVEWNFDIDAYKIYEFFLKPTVSDDYKIEWKQPNKDELMRLMVDEHDFSYDRIENTINKFMGTKREGTQSNLGDWLKK